MSAFWDSVRELAEMAKQIPPERAALSGVRRAIAEDVLSPEDRRRLDNARRLATLHTCTATSKPSGLTHFVVVRADLPLGFLAAQVVHAAGESSPGNLDQGTNAVVLSVPNEAELAAVERRLQLAGIAHVAIREPDAPWDGALCAIGLVPVADCAPVRRVLSALPLLGREGGKP